MKKIFLGPPGSGKGTAASRIAPKFKTPHISTGELFREKIKQETKIGKRAKEFMERGELVPDEIVIEMLKQRISEADCENGFILDGFPRTIPQAEMLNELTEVDIVINMDVTEEILMKRLTSRITCINCGKIYNTITIPTKVEGVCDKCQGEVKRRADEEPEVIQKRLEVYKQQTEPLIDFYKNKNLLKDVFCDDFSQTPEETAEQVMKAIEEFLEEKKKLDKK